jgi:endonuclease-3 related protein
MDKQNPRKTLLDLYQRLASYYGPQRWWPADEPFEVIVGAILGQATAWKNVEKCILGLKTAGILSPSVIRKLSQEELAGYIHASGYYNAKAAKLKAFAEWFGDNYGDSFERLFDGDLYALREKLLGVYGVGEETADCILLYAGNKPVFVVDAYTRRVVDRLGIKVEGQKYRDYQKLFMVNLPPNTMMFNEYHAYFAALCKDTCQKTPLCEDCCLGDMCASRV